MVYCGISHESLVFFLGTIQVLSCIESELFYTMPWKKSGQHNQCDIRAAHDGEVGWNIVEYTTSLLFWNKSLFLHKALSTCQCWTFLVICCWMEMNLTDVRAVLFVGSSTYFITRIPPSQLISIYCSSVIHDCSGKDTKTLPRCQQWCLVWNAAWGTLYSSFSYLQLDHEFKILFKQN